MGFYEKDITGLGRMDARRPFPFNGRVRGRPAPTGPQRPLMDRALTPIVFGYFAGGAFAFGRTESEGRRITPDTYQRYSTAPAGAFTINYTNGDTETVVLGVDMPTHTQLRPSDKAYFQHDWDRTIIIVNYGEGWIGNSQAISQAQVIDGQLISALAAVNIAIPTSPLPGQSISDFTNQRLIAIYDQYYKDEVAIPGLLGAITAQKVLEIIVKRLEFDGRLMREGAPYLGPISYTNDDGEEVEIPAGLVAQVQQTWELGQYYSQNAVDYADYEFGATLGALIGSSLGNYLGGGNPLLRTVGSAVLETIGQNLAQAIVVGGFDKPVVLKGPGDSVTFIADSALEDVDAEFLANLQGAAIGTVSSLLAMELGNALGLEGFGSQLFGTIGSTVIGAAASNVINFGVENIWSGFSFDDLFKQKVPVTGPDGKQLIDVDGNPVTQPGVGLLIANALGSFLGSKLGSLLVTPETEAAGILSSLGSAVGSWAAISTSFAGTIASTLGLNQAGLLFNLIAPGIGAFVGFVLGALFGNLFGSSKPKTPTASAETLLLFPSTEYGVGDVVAANGGNRRLVVNMAETARDMLNQYLSLATNENASTYVANVSGSGVDQKYGHSGSQIYVTIDGIQHNFNSADDVVGYGVTTAIRNTMVVGGNLFIKRVVFHSQATDLTALMGDIGVASQYESYLRYRQFVNQLIVAESNSAFTSAWALTLLRAAELGMGDWSGSDFYGGLRGFADSFDLKSAGLGYEALSVAWEGTNLRVAGPATTDLFSILPTASTDGSSVLIDNFGANVGYTTWAANGDHASNGADIAVFSGSTGPVTLVDSYETTEWNDGSYYNPETGMWEIGEPVQVTVLYTGGDDIFVGGSGNDTLTGYQGWDWLDGGAGDDLLDGGNDNDTLIGRAGRDKLLGGGGDDYLSGGDNDDNGTGGLWGGFGADVLVGGAGADALYGDDGDDVLIVDAGANGASDGAADTLNGGLGSDTVSFERFTGAVTYSLAAPSSYGDTVTGVENVTGSAYGDAITGDASANALKGLTGDDTLSGGDGDDVLEGGAGDDTLNGGAGVDFLSYSRSYEGVYVNLTTSEVQSGDATGDTFAGIENVRGSRFGDELKGDAGANRLEGLDAEDWFVATAGADVYDGGQDLDVVDYSAATSAVTLNIGAYTATTTTNGSGTGGLASGHTYIKIEAVVGTDYADSLSAGAGDQTLIGGKGNDALNGGDGSDSYILNIGDGYDTITETKDAANQLFIGINVKFSDLIFASAANSWFDISLNSTDKVRFVNNFATQRDNRLKVLDMNGFSQLSVGEITIVRLGSAAAQTVTGGSGHWDMVAAYGGNDTLRGAGPGNWEDKGNVFIGGTGDDTFYASAGDDQYAYDRGDGIDVINDEGGDDSIAFGSTADAEDIIYKVVGNDLYIGLRDLANDALDASQVADRIRVVNGGVKYVDLDTGAETLNTVEYVNAGGAWIDLRKLNVNWTVSEYYSGGGGGGYIPPIVFDLDGDGLDLTAVADSKIVTRGAGGLLTRISWVGPTDGFLAFDRDGDGAINKTSEISFTQDKAGAKSDLEGLAAWDSNGDGILDKLDANFGKLLVWVDKNQNGRSTASELRTLEQAGIASINLKGQATGYTAAMTIDSFVQNTTTFTRADGTTGAAYDVALARRFLGADGLETGPDATWRDMKGDGELGRLMNDPRAEARAARDSANQRNGEQPALGNGLWRHDRTPDDPEAAAAAGPLTNAELRDRAVTDFTDHDRMDAKDRDRWAHKLDPLAKAARLADEADGMTGEEHLPGLLAARDRDQREKARAAALAAGADGGTTQASARSAQSASRTADDPAATFVPATETAGAGFGLGSTAALDSALGGIFADPGYDRYGMGVGGALDLTTRPQTGPDAVQAWWRQGGGHQRVSEGSLGLTDVLARIQGGALSGGPEVAQLAAEGDPDLARRGQQLRQAMAAFGGEAGAAPAVWMRGAVRDGPQIAASVGFHDHAQMRVPVA